MIFKNKKQEELIEDLKNKVNSLEKRNNELYDQNFKYVKQISDLRNEITDLRKAKAENDVMRKYFKLDEELSQEVQARVLCDLRVHELEYSHLQSLIQMQSAAISSTLSCYCRC